MYQIAHLRRGARGFPLTLLSAAILLAACGSGSGEGTFRPDEVVSAFERAGGDYPFKEIFAMEPIAGAVAYGPQGNSGPAAEKRLYAGLGQDSLFWEVVIFRGSDPPTGAAAVRRAAVSSTTLKRVGHGVFLGDQDIAYAARGNVVVFGQIAHGDLHDERLKRWTAVLHGL